MVCWKQGRMEEEIMTLGGLDVSLVLGGPFGVCLL